MRCLLFNNFGSEGMDIGQVLFFWRFYGPKRTRPIFSHLDRTSLVNKGFIILPKDYTKEFRFFLKKKLFI